MTKKTRLLTFATLVVLGFSVVSAEAQYYGDRHGVGPLTVSRSGGRTYRPVNRSVYGGIYDRYYDPRRHDLTELPPLEMEECEFTECKGLKGTFHAEKGVLHFRPYDSTHTPFNMNHKNCLEVHSIGQQASSATEVPAGTTTATIGTVTRTAGRFEIENSTRMHVEVYDGSTLLGTMAPGSTLAVDSPRSHYRGVALLPNRQGGMSKDNVNIQVRDNGWTFVEPTFGG